MPGDSGVHSPYGLPSTGESRTRGTVPSGAKPGINKSIGRRASLIQNSSNLASIQSDGELCCDFLGN